MKNWLKKLNKFWSFPTTERYLFLKIGIILLSIHTLLFILPFNSFRKWYSFLLRKVNKSYDFDEVYLFRVANIIDVLGYHFSIKCLAQALSYRLYLRKDKKLQIRIGVEKNNSIFEAHAWVEKNGKILLGERKNIEFLPLWDWPDLTVKKNIL